MSAAPTNQLYELLPALYRLRDAEAGQVLQKLLAIMERELIAVRDDISQLYDDWFIETCQEWVVPYIGDLLGVRIPNPVSTETSSLRAYVANTLAYRRRKGTVSALAQLARDLTGWPARAVEYFSLIATTQHLNHLRPGNVRCPDIRDANRLELLGGPFDQVPRSADIRNISTEREDTLGRHNIPSIGIFVWPWQSYPVVRSTARAVADPADGRYTFHPLGLDTPLFNNERTTDTISAMPVEWQTPGMLRRRALYDELEARRQAAVDGAAHLPVWFGAEPVLEVYDQTGLIPPAEMEICNLSGWRRPVTPKTYVRSSDGADVDLPIRVSVDPALGRVAFPEGVVPETVEVSYSYGFLADVGGGPYDRSASVRAEGLEIGFQIGVSRDASGGDPNLVASLAEAIDLWNAQPAGTIGAIAIMDSRTYGEVLPATHPINIPEGSRLLIAAADWPLVEHPDEPPERVTGQLRPSGLRPHVRSGVVVHGTAPGESENPGEVIFNGLLIEGTLTVADGNLGRLQLTHSTLAPGFSTLSVAGGNRHLRVCLSRTICGPISLADTVASLEIIDSIVHEETAAIDAPSVACRFDNSSAFGQVTVQSLEASDSIFTDQVTVARRQEGCVRFSHVPDGSSTPRRFRCQPDLALKDQPDSARPAILRRIAPRFRSLRFGHPGYAQLSPSCAAEIAAGAGDRSEMGAFHFVMQPQRLGNLRAALDEYLRFGLRAGILFVAEEPEEPVHEPEE